MDQDERKLLWEVAKKRIRWNGGPDDWPEVLRLEQIRWMDWEGKPPSPEFAALYELLTAAKRTGALPFDGLQEGWIQDGTATEQVTPPHPDGTGGSSRRVPVVRTVSVPAPRAEDVAAVVRGRALPEMLAAWLAPYQGAMKAKPGPKSGKWKRELASDLLDKLLVAYGHQPGACSPWAAEMVLEACTEIEKACTEIEKRRSRRVFDIKAKTLRAWLPGRFPSGSNKKVLIITGPASKLPKVIGQCHANYFSGGNFRLTE